MFDIPIATAIAWLILGLTILCVACFRFGISVGEQPQYPQPSRTRRVPEDPPVGSVEGDALIREMEVVMLPAATAEIGVIPGPSYSALPEMVSEANPAEAAAVAEVLEQLRDTEAVVVELAEKLDWTARTKKRALRAVRVSTARVAFLADAVTRPRRPSKVALQSELLEVGDRKVRAVPPAIAREWEEEAS